MVLMRFAKWMVPFRAYEYPQIREKPLRSKCSNVIRQLTALNGFERRSTAASGKRAIIIF